MNGLIEILKTKEWAIAPDYLKGTVKLLSDNLRNHTQLEAFQKKLPYAMVFNAEEQKLQSYTQTMTGDKGSSWDAASIRQPFVNIMTIDGPITRAGGACSYGSKDLRDQIIRCADNPLCAGHLFCVDTPGGTTWCINDFRQGIDYAHERGQRVMMFVDGDCFSCGMWLATLCDEIYVMNEEDGLGCIGVLASFFTMKNGAHNDFNAEDYHEIYDPESYDKNRMIRDVANSEDDKLLVELLSKLGVDFRTDIQEAFPQATEEHIHGKIFAAREVMGIFCDGISTMEGCVQRLFDLANGVATPIGRTNNINTNNTGMNIFQKIGAAISQVEKEAKQEGYTDNPNEEIAQLRGQMAQLQQERDDARAQVETLTGERDTLNARVEDLTGQNKTLGEEKETLTEQVNALTEERDNLKNQVTEKDDEIIGLKKQIKSDYVPGNRVGAQPAGEGAQEGKQSREEAKNQIRQDLGIGKKKTSK